MSNQWFYINRWRQNRETSWVVVDKFGKIIKENIDKYLAEEFKYQLENENKGMQYFIVNKNDTQYDEIVAHINLKEEKKK